MDKQIDSAVMRHNPELVGNYHLPMFARIEAISDPLAQAEVSEQFRPRFAADVVVLDEDDQPDIRFPLFRAVPLPAYCAGLERGVFGFPSPGTIVELVFAYGMPSKPFIRTVLTDGLSVPELQPEELLLQNSPGVAQRADMHGNWSRETHANILDSALVHEIKSYLARIETNLLHTLVLQHSTEEVRGIKTIEALGALKLLSGGALHLSAVGDLKIVAAKDQKNKVVNDLVVRVGNIADSFAQVKQLITVKDGGTVWLGSESENVLQILSELIQVVADIANTAAIHKHEYTDNGNPMVTKVPQQAGDFNGEKGSADGLKGRLDPIVEL